MNAFSNDADILRFEPALFGDLHLPGQVLISSAAGAVSGTTLTDSTVNFNNAQIAAGCVVYMQTSDGGIDGAYEIVSVDSATQLTVSVLRIESDDDAIAPPASSDITYYICTYQPQSNEVLFQLSQYFGLAPGTADSDYDVDDILDIAVLRQASIYATLAVIYAMLAGRTDNNEENFWKKSMHYQRQFEKARERCRVNIDAGSDGASDKTNSGASARLLRD